MASAGGNHNVVAFFRDAAVTWGYNFTGQQGDGTFADRLAPGGVTGFATGFHVSAGLRHSLAADGAGRVFAWGDNASSQLGGPSGPAATTARQVAGLPMTILAVAAGGYHSLALDWAGEVWCWGNNEVGPCGGAAGIVTAPRTIAGLADIVAISAGYQHTLALDGTGAVFALGWNADGQLGDGSTTTRTAPVQVLAGAAGISAGRFHSLAVMRDGTIRSWGAAAHGDGMPAATRRLPGPVPGVTGATAVAAGAAHSLALAGGRLLGWGRDGGGQLGTGTTAFERLVPAPSLMAGAVAIDAGGSHSIAIDGNGDVWTWGSGTYGQIGDGAALAAQPNPIRATTRLGPGERRETTAAPVVMPAVAGGR